MKQPSASREHDFSQRIIAAFTNLADLSLRTSTRRFSSPGTWEHQASVFFSRLAALCGAQQGALLLVHPPADQLPAQFQPSFAGQPGVSLLAHAYMSAEDIQAVLAAYLTASDPPECFAMDLMDFPPILVWKRELPASLTTVSFPEETVGQLGPHSSILFFFVWPAVSQHARLNPFSEREQASRLLLFLTNLVDTILLHLLGASQEEKQPKEEILPTELLATVGHEFRGPLTTIQGYASTLLHHEQHLSSEERREFLVAIEQAGAHLSRLVDHFLQLAQLEARSHLFAPVAVDFAALAREAITAAKQSRPHILLLISSHGPTPPAEQAEELLSENAPGEELTAWGDRRLLRTLLDVLLENALAYSTHESLVEVHLHPADPARLWPSVSSTVDPETRMALILPATFAEHESLLEIEVRDRGRGIPADHLPRIFHRFYREDTRLTRETGGLGLGLALCQAIVEKHRGMLWVESSVGVGSTFHIVLPRAVVPPTNEMV